MKDQFRARFTFIDNDKWFVPGAVYDDIIGLTYDTLSEYLTDTRYRIDDCPDYEIFDRVNEEVVLRVCADVGDPDWVYIDSDFELQQFINGEWVNVEMGAG